MSFLQMPNNLLNMQLADNIDFKFFLNRNFSATWHPKQDFLEQQYECMFDELSDKSTDEAESMDVNDENESVKDELDDK